jgi:hypothetical protein
MLRRAQTVTTFQRRFNYPRLVSAGLKAAKTLDLAPIAMEAHGRWRSLQPFDGGYRDFDGPFPVSPGVGPAFVRGDGTEVFMLDDSAHVIVTFLAEESP